MPKSPLHNEQELLHRLNDGSEYAFAQLFNYYRGHIYGVALKLLRSPVLAEEIVQDVFLKVWLKRTELSAVKRFDAFLFIMARNLIFDRLKKSSYETMALLDELSKKPSDDNAEYLIRQHECEQLIQQIIMMLPPQQKEAYRLARQEGMNHKMIAEKMQLSQLTVKSYMADALKFIRKYLNTHLTRLFL